MFKLDEVQFTKIKHGRLLNRKFPKEEKNMKLDQSDPLHKTCISEVMKVKHKKKLCFISATNRLRIVTGNHSFLKLLQHATSNFFLF